MSALALALGTAAWLGILTAISPCPLATNVAAIAFVSRDAGSPRRALAAALAYSVGRSLAYVGLAAVAVFAMTRLLSISSFLQGTFYKLLGPFLILTGMVLLGLIDINLRGRSAPTSGENVLRGGVWSAAGLGIFFALSFCPVSAALFFGGLIPLAVEHESVLAVPAIYGFATGLPVAFFGVTIVAGAKHVAERFEAARRWHKPATFVTGVVFVCVGVYESLRGVFGVL